MSGDGGRKAVAGQNKADDGVNQLDNIIDSTEVDEGVFNELMNQTSSATADGASGNIPYPSKMAKMSNVSNMNTDQNHNLMQLQPQMKYSQETYQKQNFDPKSHPNIPSSESNPLYTGSNYQSMPSSNPTHQPKTRQNSSLLLKILSHHQSQSQDANQIQQNYSRQPSISQSPQIFPNNPMVLENQKVTDSDSRGALPSDSNTETQNLQSKSTSLPDRNLDPEVREATNALSQIIHSMTVPIVEVKPQLQKLVRREITVESFVNDMGSYCKINPIELSSMLNKYLPILRRYIPRPDNSNQRSGSMDSDPKNKSSDVNISTTPFQNSHNSGYFNQKSSDRSEHSQGSSNNFSSHQSSSPFLRSQSSQQPQKTILSPPYSDVQNINMDHLQNIILRIMSKIDISEVSGDVPKIIAHALHLKLSQIVHKLYLTTYHRIITKKLPVLPINTKLHIKQDDSTKKGIGLLNRISEDSQRYVDAHNMINSIRTAKMNKGRDFGPNRSSSAPMINNQAALEEERQREANKTAMAALSSLSKRNRSDILSHENEERVTLGVKAPTIYKSTLKDLTYVLEHDKNSQKSLALYQACLK